MGGKVYHGQGLQITKIFHIRLSIQSFRLINPHYLCLIPGPLRGRIIKLLSYPQ